MQLKHDILSKKVIRRHSVVAAASRTPAHIKAQSLGRHRDGAPAPRQQRLHMLQLRKQLFYGNAKCLNHIELMIQSNNVSSAHVQV